MAKKEEVDRKESVSEEKTEQRDYELVEEGGEEIMRVNSLKWPYSPSVEDSSAVMGFAIDRLVNVPQVSRIIFKQRRNYAYDYEQTQMLVEIAQLYDHVVRQKKVFGPNALGGLDPRFLQLRANAVNYIVFNLLRTDPVGAYVELKRLIREEKIHLKGDIDSRVIESRQTYLGNLMYLYTLLGQTSLIKKVEDNLDGYSIGDRGLYKEVFRPVITPDFMYTRLMAETPIDGEQVDFYTVGEAEINLYKIPGDIKTLYHVNPPEFKLSEDEYALLDLAKQVLAEHKPREEEFLDPSKMRRTFFNIGRDLITELAETKRINLPYSKIHELASILVRYTVGFGLIEILLQDPKIQDITINGPAGASPMYIVHQDYDECATNIIPSVEDAESWASKFRLISGRPLDEANPVLDTELAIPGARARVAVMTKPLSPTGLAYALRRHRDNPWTLPLFIQNGMIDPLGAGLMSFMIDGARTILVAGTRSSGKTSFLGSILVEIMRRYRVLTIEDTLELPVKSLRDLGYNIQQMKVRAALTMVGGELAADEGIRTSLRLGDSSLIVGEVRSLEAKALYEAMRVGALANVVAGTIHGASPYGVYDRVVNDLEVPKTSFKATDLIVVANPIKTPDGLHRKKRITQITEVRKHWVDDPLAENGFVDLMKYNPEKDILEPTDALINGESETLKAVATNVKEWAGDWDSIWNNVLLRAKLKEMLVGYSNKLNNKKILEAPFVVASNDAFHRISDDVRIEVGALDSKMIASRWEDWVKNELKKK
ncbi:MAG: type II/IV secretion system ATPase subunit [Candidatus Nanoarchaeia archaeon]|nr:type II/IV secretion system ATPase subunit [Candidatus Nanoarchaeia archaeon]